MEEKTITTIIPMAKTSTITIISDGHILGSYSMQQILVLIFWVITSYFHLQGD
jgi:hypothetical protein